MKRERELPEDTELELIRVRMVQDNSGVPVDLVCASIGWFSVFHPGLDPVAAIDSLASQIRDVVGRVCKLSDYAGMKDRALAALYIVFIEQNRAKAVDRFHATSENSIAGSECETECLRPAPLQCGCRGCAGGLYYYGASSASGKQFARCPACECIFSMGAGK